MSWAIVQLVVLRGNEARRLKTKQNETIHCWRRPSNDRKFNGSHYGHLCMARIAADKIILVDQKGLAMARPEGATGEPPTPKGRKNVSFPLSLDPEAWHSFMLETVGDTMRASIDGKPWPSSSPPASPTRRSPSWSSAAWAKAASLMISRSGARSR